MGDLIAIALDAGLLDTESRLIFNAPVGRFKPDKCKVQKMKGKLKPANL
jgi:hypothetical protein